MKSPSLHKAEDLINGMKCMALVDGRYVPARPLGMSSILNRFKYAWYVFAGKADALIWEKQ